MPLPAWGCCSAGSGVFDVAASVCFTGAHTAASCFAFNTAYMDKTIGYTVNPAEINLFRTSTQQTDPSGNIGFTQAVLPRSCR